MRGTITTVAALLLLSAVDAGFQSLTFQRRHALNIGTRNQPRRHSSPIAQDAGGEGEVGEEEVEAVRRGGKRGRDWEEGGREEEGQGGGRARGEAVRRRRLGGGGKEGGRAGC